MRKRIIRYASIKSYTFPLYFIIMLVSLFLAIYLHGLKADAAGKQKAKAYKSKGLEIVNISNGYVLPEKRKVQLVVKRTSKKIKKKNLLYRSTNTKVAKVSKNGKVTAQKKGNCYIYVYNKMNKKQQSRVKIYVGKRIQKLVLKTDANVLLTKGRTYKPQVDIKPAKAAYKKLEWTSSDITVCKINSSTGSIYAVEAGKAVITARAKDGSGKKVKFNVKVIPLAYSVTITSTLKYPYMAVGDTTNLKATVNPQNANQKVVWSSSDNKVATVDQNGCVKACGKGTVTIKASATSGSLAQAGYKITVPSVDKKKTTLVAHRGYSSIAPENTVASYKAAAAQAGFTAIECDVFRTTDGVFVNHHDKNLKRVFLQNKIIYECAYEDIKDLAAKGGNGYENYPAETTKLCRLDQYMDILKQTNKRAIIELKEAYSQAISDELFDMISSYGFNDRIDIISFSFDSLDNISTAMDSYTDRHPGMVLKKPDLYLLTEKPDTAGSAPGDMTPVDWALARGYNLSIKHIALTEDNIKKIHKAGKKVGTWTVDQYELACHYIWDMGVDCLTSNLLLFK